MLRMTSLKCWNSGVELNLSSFINSPMEHEVSSRAPFYGASGAHFCCAVFFAGELFVGDATANNLLHDERETLGVSQLAVVKAKRLFVNVAEQVKRLNGYVSPIYPTLQETPEVLATVRVYLSIHIRFSMIDHLMHKIIAKPFVGLQRVTVEHGADFHVLIHEGLQFALAAIADNLRTDLATALQNGSDYSLTFRPASYDLLGPLVSVHVPRFAADESLVYFDFTTELVKTRFLHRKANAVKHKPSRLLSYLQAAMQFIRTDTVLAIDNQPSGSKPLIQTQWGVFEYGSSLQ